MSDVATPMMQQYQRIRSSLPADTLLFFRVGDFYEMFFDDAKEASAILDLTLTKKGVVPMAGVPFHSAESYIQRIIKAGKRVAICEQLGEPVKGQVVQREITQVVSPGTVSDAGMLDSKQNNFLAAVSIGQKKGYGFAFIDLSTGDFRLTELADKSELASELARVRPVELLVSDEQADELKWLGDVVVRDGYPFLFDQAHFSLTDHFKVKSLDGFGCGNTPAAVCAAGAILHYLKVEMRRSLAHVKRLKTYRTTEFMILDATTQSNLELVKSRGGSRDTSLLKALDRTVTPMGARRLQDWILHPLCDVTVLNARQQMVADLLAVPALIFNLRDALKGIRDIERLLGRLTQSGGNARDLQALCVSLQQIPQIHEELGNLITSTGGADQAPRKMSVRLLDKIKRYDHLVELLSRAIVDEPPALTKEGGMFREGYYPQLDELHAASRDGRDWIAQLQQRLVDETGIKSLRVKYTSVFGYFIEVTTSNLSLVPETWHRKQTISNGERFITPELKEMEGKILGADERSKALEYELFVQLRDEVLLDLASLQTTAETVGILDVMCSFAETARLFSYCRPKVHTDSRIDIVDGRHPVLDQSIADEKFVPNDVLLDEERNRLLILTGPNMAGKSTYIRQVALLVLMAQIGSFIPAKSAEIGLADRIFTRVGANDDLARGQSTFMVEMSETANITNNATSKSLIILDEIGRGTSTFDGLSIAWSVAEYLHDEVKARTLFATHYHELTDLERTHAGVRNYNVAVSEQKDQIVFLRKIVKGGASKSYGIQVARLAGLPDKIIQRSKVLLANLERHELTDKGKPSIIDSAE